MRGGQRWNRQVFLATHSPVLISQFQPSDVVVAGAGQDRSTTLRRVSEIRELQDVIRQDTRLAPFIWPRNWAAEFLVILTFHYEWPQMTHEICRFGLVVTGKGEEESLPQLFRVLMAKAYCVFSVIRRVGQRNPVTAPTRLLQNGW